MGIQNFENHGKIVLLYHRVLFGIIVVTFIGSLVNLYQALGDHSRVYNAALIAALSVACGFVFYFCRVFPLKAQDRAIRAEENLRHFVISGKLLDPRLTLRQIVALRFASDGEFVELANKAANQSMEAKEIKQAVKNWRADHDRL